MGFGETAKRPQAPFGNVRYVANNPPLTRGFFARCLMALFNGKLERLGLGTKKPARGRLMILMKVLLALELYNYSSFNFPGCC